MATFPGFKTGSPEGGADNPRISVNLGGLERADLYPYSLSEASGIGGGALTNNVPIEQAALSLQGFATRTFFDDWYYRVHIVPRVINLGSVVQLSVRSVEVWSAHFATNALSAIVEDGTEGLTLSGPVPPPTDFGALESRIYSLTVDTTGPARVDATYTFVFALDDPDPTLKVVGDRVLPFVFPPNWGRPVVERLAWLTDVIRADNGKERRVRVREGPRFELEYSILLGTDRDRVRLENTLHEWQGRTFGVPLWYQQERTSVAIPINATSVSVDTETTSYVVGGLAALVDGRVVELLEIDDVTPGVVSFATPTTRAFPVGSKVAPARLARLPRSVSLDYRTDAIVAAALRFEGTEEETITAKTEAADYRGYPVLTDRRDWSVDAGGEFPRLVVEVDFATGATLRDDRADFSPARRRSGYLFADRTATDAFREFLSARAGRLSPIWVPSGHNDFLVVSTIASSAASIRVENRGHELVDGQLGRGDLEILLYDGTRYRRRITGVSVVDEDEELVAIDSELGANVEPSEIKQVAYLGLSRLAADTVEIAHGTDESARSLVAFELLRDDVP